MNNYRPTFEDDYNAWVLYKADKTKLFEYSSEEIRSHVIVRNVYVEYR